MLSTYKQREHIGKSRQQIKPQVPSIHISKSRRLEDGRDEDWKMAETTTHLCYNLDDYSRSSDFGHTFNMSSWSCNLLYVYTVRLDNYVTELSFYA